METVALTCQHCAAPLPDLPQSVRQVRCTHCGSLLHIERDGTRAWTEVVAELSRKQRRLAERVRKLEARQIARRRRRERRSADGDELPFEARALGITGALAASLLVASDGEAWAWAVGLGVVALIAGVFFWRSREADRRWDRLRFRRRSRRIHNTGERPADRR